MPSPFVVLSKHSSHEIRWLWHHRIPLGALTVIEGDPGTNKSTLAYDLSARLSAGTAMPLGDCEQIPATTLLLQAEDTLDTIKARLLAAGADVSKVVAYDRDLAADNPLTIPDRIGDLEQQIEASEARLVVIDPITSFLGRSVSQDQSVRQSLGPLAALAERRSIAIVLVRHLTKNQTANPLYRGAGSIAVIGAARSALLVATDPSERDRRVLVQTKSSWGKKAESLVFSLDGQSRDVRIEWLGACPYTAEDVLEASKARRTELEEAMYLVYSVLADGPMLARRVQAKGREAGFAPRSLRRAKEALKVESKRKGFGPGSQIFWVLPEDAKLTAQFRARDIEELTDKLCHGPTDVDLADDGSFSFEQFFGDRGGHDDEADWWKKRKPPDDIDDGGDDEPFDPREE